MASLFCPSLHCRIFVSDVQYLSRYSGSAIPSFNFVDFDSKHRETEMGRAPGRSDGNPAQIFNSVFSPMYVPCSTFLYCELLGYIALVSKLNTELSLLPRAGLSALSK